MNLKKSTLSDIFIGGDHGGVLMILLRMGQFMDRNILGLLISIKNDFFCRVRGTLRIILIFYVYIKAIRKAIF
jgi:hypothetical protein